MSSHDGHIPPPPPPPRPGLGAASVPLRRRNGLAQPPTISTASLTGPQASLSMWSASTIDSATPLSPYASAGYSPFAQHRPALSAGTSPMALRAPSSMVVEYNPQEWGRGGPTGGAYRPHAAQPSREADPLNGIPSPPPPYSPPSSQDTTPGTRMSSTAAMFPQGASEYSSPASSVMSGLPTQEGSSRPAVSMGALPPQATPAFPPPPQSCRDRSGSRHRPEGQRSLFNLAALTARNKSADRSSTQNAMDALRQNTADLLLGSLGSPGSSSTTTAQLLAQKRPPGMPSNRSSLWIPPEPSANPPSSRRSASASAVSSPTDGSSQWDARMPLPPPPPGPPPSEPRSSSLPRESSSNSLSADIPSISMPTRRPHQRGTRLDPVPPTPAGWTEVAQRSAQPASTSRERSSSPLPLRIDTSSAQGKRKQVKPEAATAQASSSSTVTLPPPRDCSNKGIRERRSESRATKDRAQSQENITSDETRRDGLPASSTMPADLVLTPPSSGISRQGAVKKSRTSMSPGLSKQMNLRRRATDIDLGSTPPFSPDFGSDEILSLQPRDLPANLPPKALPTPPSHRASNEFVPPTDSAESNKPHQRELLNLETKMSKSTNDSQLPVHTKPASTNALDEFTQACLERHKRFIESERSATSDRLRLELFAEFIVAESRLRRDHYSAAFAAMGADIFDLTRDLWKSYQPSPTAAGNLSKLSMAPETPSDTLPTNRKDSMDSSAIGTSPASRSNFTPKTESEPASDVETSAGNRESGLWNAYQPVLSPIPSMNMSTLPDEDLSRGRPPSRWWESSGSQSGGNGTRVERSKRESKYMGVPKEVRLKWQDLPSPLPDGGGGSKQAAQPEYPPEKVGWHEDGQQGPSSTSQLSQFWRHSAPNTPDPHKLDVSRLVTLPPPYPRHYPAMNNNHPDLASVRTNLRTLTDLSEVHSTKEAFRTKVLAQRTQQADEASSRRREMRHNIQEQLSLGQMTYASAAAAESQFNEHEVLLTQRAVQTEFDAFQPEVMSPLHALLSERITKANACMSQLQSGLSDEADDNASKNEIQPQEEGDEMPELLEKLNLLKWLFEARETLHRELFELENERNQRYRDVVVTPFRARGEGDKIGDAEQFFEQDACERKDGFVKKKLRRFEEFSRFVEEQVQLGADAHLNAFWDIAPGLLAVVQKVPVEDLRGFDVHIPPGEYEENPRYHEFPLQYLYSLLDHAEKATYQFIESQTNLMCLLHEAMTGVMVAGLGSLESQRVAEGEDSEAVKLEMQEIRKAEEERLTMDLKEKVSTIETQWRDGLGSGLAGCKDRVEAFLKEQGGWDEALKE